MNAALKHSRPRMESFPSQATTICVRGMGMGGFIPFKESKGKEREYGSSGETSPVGSFSSSEVSSRRMSSEDREVDKPVAIDLARKNEMQCRCSFVDNPVGEGCSRCFSGESLCHYGSDDTFSGGSRDQTWEWGSCNAYGVRVSCQEVDACEDTLCEESGICDTPGVALVKSGVRAVVKFTAGVSMLRIPGIGVRKCRNRAQRLLSRVSGARRTV